MVNPISGVGSVQQPQSVKNADSKLLAAIASIVTGNASSDVAKVAIASQLKSETSGLKQLAGNLAQGASLVQTADSGAEQISKALGQLQSLADAANSPVQNADTRSQLNEQFQQILNQVDQIATSTTFNGKALLDGSLSGNNSLSLDSILTPGAGSSGSDLSIGNLTTGGLFGGQSLNILSADTAGQSIAAIAQALNQVTNARSDIGGFQDSLNFASANVDTAINNQEAAQSSLASTDITSASTISSIADVQQNASVALAAQGNRLSPALLQLIG